MTHYDYRELEPMAAPQQKALVVVELRMRELVSHLEAFESSRLRRGCGAAPTAQGGSVQL